VTIDPLFSLALSMHGNPGVYALLLGSGVSRSAGMPTGWEVVTDLILKLASVTNEDAGPDPEAWFSKKFGEAPTYSGLLEVVARSQAERSQLLRSYFEPSDEDRLEGRKLPTKAHRAIAALVKMGIVRVVVTTNFDRLLESALEAEGINPTVIASSDDVDGALPITHSRCTVIKVHGDYLDLRTRNTPVELQAYDDRLNELLDRVFDEFGLIVAGWSAEWDAALCGAVARAKGRRFTTYWTKHSKLVDAALRLVDHRSALVIEIKSADEFFDTLAEKLRVLADSKAPHPLSVQAAIAQTKRYLPEVKHAIRLHDLLMSEIEKVIEETGSSHYPVQAAFSEDEFAKRAGEIEALSIIAASIMATGCFWGAPEHHALWIRALNRLGNRDGESSGVTAYLQLQAYPTVLVQYAGGIAASAAGNLETAYALLIRPRINKRESDESFSTALLRDVPQESFTMLPGLDRLVLARSERLYKVLREPLRALLPSDSEYTQSFDLFETLQSVATFERVRWAMPGAYMYRYYVMRGGRALLRRDGSPLLRLKDEVATAGQKAAVLQAGFLQGSLKEWEDAVKLIDEQSEGFH
jgi:hypothetical protein